MSARNERGALRIAFEHDISPEEAQRVKAEVDQVFAAKATRPAAPAQPVEHAHADEGEH